MLEDYFAKLEDQLQFFERRLQELGMTPNKSLFADVRAFAHLLEGRHGPINDLELKNRIKDLETAVYKLDTDIKQQFDRKNDELSRAESHLSKLTVAALIIGTRLTKAKG